MSDDLYYLQDSRSYVGNDMQFWAKDGNGYTTDLCRAHVYSKDEATTQNRMRETDIPWPKAYIDARVRTAVDFQHVSKEEALRGTGIVLAKPKPLKKEKAVNCCGCGKFVSERSRWAGPHACGADNRP